jgi:dihydroxyacid dehydratase/phosphogluconate dehydratase
MGSPEGKKGEFTGAARTGDTIQIDVDRVLGWATLGDSFG